jgi:hypothetical protein
MSTIVFPQGDATITVPANGSIAVASYAEAQVFRIVGFPNFPEQSELLGVVESNTITVFGPYTTGATIQIQAGATQVLYNVGTAPTIPELGGARTRVVATAVDVTGPITAAAIMGGVVTSAAAAVTGTVPTGAVLDAAVELAIGEAFEWSIIKTGANTFTVSDAANHTIVGTLTVATVTSGRFLTVKTAAGVFVSYRIA